MKDKITIIFLVLLWYQTKFKVNCAVEYPGDILENVPKTQEIEFCGSEGAENLKKLQETVEAFSHKITKLIEIDEEKQRGKDFEENNEKPTNCYDLYQKGDKKTGVRTIYPFKKNHKKSVRVLCDQETEPGGWTVIQQRNLTRITENSIKFGRSMLEYENGFGNISVDGDFWLGLSAIHALTTSTYPVKMLYDLSHTLDYGTNTLVRGEYGIFVVRNSSDSYQLNCGKHVEIYGALLNPVIPTVTNKRGYAKNSKEVTIKEGADSGILMYADFRKFTTFDTDYPSGNLFKKCENSNKGGWWYKNDCKEPNPNSILDEWSTSIINNLDYKPDNTLMMIRPIIV